MALELIDEREMPPATDAAIRRLLAACFPADAEAFAERRAWNGVAPIFTVIWRNEGAVLGHVGVVAREIRCGDTPVRVAGIQSLCVAPELRGTGVSEPLMQAALDEAARRGLPFALLFCLPELERFYAAGGWTRLDRPVTMLDENGRPAPLPSKNIAMQIALGEERLPPGPVDLRGRDW